jgi:hypothetical protein
MAGCGDCGVHALLSFFLFHVVVVVVVVVIRYELSTELYVHTTTTPRQGERILELFLVVGNKCGKR